MKSNFEEKREKRIERLRALAAKRAAESNTLFEQSKKMASVIPMGQPILVGHHSEKRDRNYRNKIENKMRQAFDAGKQAEHYESRLAAAESNNSISSDDPNALEKLREKLDNLVKLQDLMKACNKIISGKAPNKNERLIAAGLPERYVNEIQQPDHCGRIGFPSFKLTNNNANIRRIKERITILERAAKQQDKQTEIGDITVEQSTEHNRVLVFFPGKPADEIRSMLKSSGFRWAPSIGAWINYINERNYNTAVQIAQKAAK